MIEILVVFGLCRKIGSVMRDKGRKPLGMQILAVLAWFGAEILFMIAVTIATGGEGDPILYIGALLAAGVAGWAVYAWAKSLPPLEGYRDSVEGGEECPECGEVVTTDRWDCPVCGAELRRRRTERTRAELDSFENDDESRGVDRRLVD